ncbi:hypothetical protein [Ferrimonas lipolytica]|uniref:Uncharacterized protein n=1 Tax=Ferrimonas lipolytica TaxID=2724191 RepID=A0A6H1UFD8_9GAMM|nr:hypothetical protein [Ferrimonas lipolytica]QIZ77538.1 hypothetical protein HER31_11940 [Ferrimonas lipolytica]
MKYKIAVFIQALFSLIGLALITVSGFNSIKSTLIYFVLYVLIPAYGAYGSCVKSRIAIAISLFFFVSQSIRSVSDSSVIPYIAPLALSFPFGDFSNGQGYLIDFFAIFMALFLGWLLKAISCSSTPLK